ncbi:hypothetical protein NDU88_005629 [Pleurodeles waltl]|uniref:Uncharacterized protein n=1 Tax=Pleurodeles waltl TaxID=8319 RepID=A0AAV7MWX3_PLEWA|nr:hypothetical protein NDU88_005629 [Pleurodeles waltl]
MFPPIPRWPTDRKQGPLFISIIRSNRLGAVVDAHWSVYANTFKPLHDTYPTSSGARCGVGFPAIPRIEQGDRSTN